MSGIILSALLILLFLGSITPAHAYLGPGLGLGAIGAVLGLILSLFLALFAIFWYPIKRRFKKKPKPDGEDS